MNARQAKKLRQYARGYVTGELTALRSQLHTQLAGMRDRAETHKPRLVPQRLWDYLVATVLTRAMP